MKWVVELLKDHLPSVLDDLGYTSKTGGTASLVIAASNSPQVFKNRADYQCDGVQDQVEINAAIASLTSTSGSIFLAQGDYYIDSAILFPWNDLIIRGCGISTVIIRSADQTFNMLELGDRWGIVLQDFCIHGNGDGAGYTTPCVGVYIDDGENLRIRNISFMYIPGSSGGDGIFVRTAGIPGTPQNVLVTDCKFLAIGDDAIDINLAQYWTVSNCIFSSIGDNGIDTDGSKHCNFIGNHFNYCDYGIELEDEGVAWTEYCTVIGNTFANCTEAIHILSGRYNTICGNSIDDGTWGITLGFDQSSENESNYNVLTGNFISNCTYGIEEMDGEADHNLIADNKYFNISSTEEIISGANTSNPQHPDQVNAVADTNSSSTTFVLIDGMTVTPGTGQYMVMFSSSIECMEPDTEQFAILYVGGSPVAHTERKIDTEASLANTSFPISIQALVSVTNAAHAIEVRWKCPTGDQMTCHQRTLVVKRI